MKTQQVQAFHGNPKVKEMYLNQVRQWMQSKRKPPSPNDIMNELFPAGGIKSFKPSDCILENYELFPEKLGLPLWIANLLSSIHHFNSKDFSLRNEHYEFDFYERFILACNVGVDYTLLFHKWELLLLTEILPKSERQRKYIIAVTDLHRKALAGIEPDRNEWVVISDEINEVLNNLDEFTGVTQEMVKKEIDAHENLNAAKGNGFDSYKDKHAELMNIEAVRKAYRQVIWDSGRATFLSVNEEMNVEKVCTSSATAVVDAIWQETLISGDGKGQGKEDEVRKKAWDSIMKALLDLLSNTK